jgi:hypothetical protein
MAGEHIESEAHSGDGSNGASMSVAAQRAATLAALESGEHLADGTDAKPAKSKPVETDDADDSDDDLEADDDTADADVDEERDEVVADESDDDDDEEEREDEDEEEVDPAKEPDLAKRLDKVRRAERRSKETIARERSTFEKERDEFIAQWKPRVEAAAKFEKLAGRVRYNLVEVLAELGVNVEDDGEELARELYAHSKKGGADPNNKAAVARSRRERELMDEVRELKKRVEDREQTEKQTAAQRQQEEQTKAYISRVAKAASDAQPLVKKLLTTDTARAHSIIASAAVALLDELGEEPSRTRVLARAEKMWRRELKKIGVDPDAIAKAPAQVAGSAKKTAPVAKGNDVKKTGTTPAKTIRDHRAETLRKLESGELD